MIKRRQFMQAAAAASAAEPVAEFFTEHELAALRRLSETIMPAVDGTPCALEAGAPEFLDFLIAQSPAERQQLHQSGLGPPNLLAALLGGKGTIAAPA
jgi:gluconate 2-dehydrogenase subunit 3-like protein